MVPPVLRVAVVVEILIVVEAGKFIKAVVVIVPRDALKIVTVPTVKNVTMVYVRAVVGVLNAVDPKINVIAVNKIQRNAVAVNNMSAVMIVAGITIPQKMMAVVKTNPPSVILVVIPVLPVNYLITYLLVLLIPKYLLRPPPIPAKMWLTAAVPLAVRVELIVLIAVKPAVRLNNAPRFGIVAIQMAIVTRELPKKTFSARAVL